MKCFLQNWKHEKEAAELLSALIGLVRVGENHERDSRTLQLALQALLLTDPDGEASPEALEACLQEVRAERQRLAPDCAVCPHPCDNGRVYRLEEWEDEETAAVFCKQAILRELQKLARLLDSRPQEDAERYEDRILKGLYYAGYRIGAEYLDPVLRELMESVRELEA